MAKTPSKTPTKTARKVATKSSTATSSTTDLVEKASSEALSKLRELEIEKELQNDIEWCLGSYRADRNPVGLYAMLERALKVFEDEKAKKTKGITAKLVTDLQKVLKTRGS